jgi:hypothetical protein
MSDFQWAEDIGTKDIFEVGDKVKCVLPFEDNLELLNRVGEITRIWDDSRKLYPYEDVTCSVYYDDEPVNSWTFPIYNETTYLEKIYE